MRRKLTYAFLTTVVVLGVAILGWRVRNRALPADQRESVQKRVDELKAEAKAGPPARSVLRGRPQPGNAWEEYALALKQMRTWEDGEDGVPIYFAAAGVREVDPAVAERFVAKRLDALEHLRLGAQRADGRYISGSESLDWDNRFMNLLAGRELANLVAMQSKLLVDSGKPQEAVNVLLDLATFARDLMLSGPVQASTSGYEIYRLTFGQPFRKLIESGRLSKSQLAQLGEKLEILDREFPTLKSVFAFENLAFGESLLTDRSIEQAFDDTERVAREDWRFLIAPLTTKVDAFQQKEILLKRIAPLDGMTYAEAQREAEAIVKDAESAPNRLVASVMPNVVRILRAHREALTRLRLLRAGVGVFANGKASSIPDPFGDTLFSTGEDGKVTIWSAGRDVTNARGPRFMLNNNDAYFWEIEKPAAGK
jgi:hypothetical protein